jgi:hypothetical protein
MPEIFRTVLVMREFEDMAYQDIADVLGISIGTVESRLFRARGTVQGKAAPVAPGVRGKDDGVMNEGHAMDMPRRTRLDPGYLDGELNESAAAPLRKHLLDCQPCRGQRAVGEEPQALVPKAKTAGLEPGPARLLGARRPPALRR